MTRKRKISTDHAPRQTSAYAASAVKYARSLRMVGAAIFPPGVTLFVLLFAWYLWAVVDLRLVFQGYDMLFLWNFHYFTDFIGESGALLVWADKLLVQSCYLGWPGAVAIAAIAWLLFISTSGLMSVLGRARIGGTWVIPGVLLVSLYGSCLFPTSAVVGLTLAIGAANVWCRTPHCRPWLRLLLFAAISAVLYYVAGDGYYCFAACAAIHEALTRREQLSGALFVLVAVAVKIGLDAVLVRLNLASHNFHVFSLVKQQPMPFEWRETALYLYFPACALFAASREAAVAAVRALWRRLRKSDGDVLPQERCTSGRDNRQPSAPTERCGGWKGAAIRWAAETALVLLLAGAAGYASFDRQRKLLQEIDYCAEHRLWDEVLAKAEKLPRWAYSPYVSHDVNLALYHAGLLPHRMFSYPQPYCFPGLMVTLLAPGEVPSGTLFHKPFGLLMELGRVGNAEQVAMEMLETRPTGAAIKGLALLKMIKDQPVDARVALNILRDDLVWGRWAERYLQRLAADPHLADDDEIQQSRAMMLLEDDLYATCRFVPQSEFSVSVSGMLVGLLWRNAENRMAFEYVMAICLCSKDVQGVVQLLQFLDGLSYPGIPPLYEEAVLIYLRSHPEEATIVGSDLLFRGRRISESSREKYQRLLAIADRNGGLNEKAEAAVARELGDTYFHYFFYGLRRQP
jgi:hypothetical protein